MLCATLLHPFFERAGSTRYNGQVGTVLQCPAWDNWQSNSWANPIHNGVFSDPASRRLAHVTT